MAWLNSVKDWLDKVLLGEKTDMKKEEILELQRHLGVEQTGEYDSETRKAHQGYKALVKEQGKAATELELERARKKAGLQYITLKDKPITKEEFETWQKGIPERWSAEHIAEVQQKLGLQATGVWSGKTAKAQETYFKTRESRGEEAAKVDLLEKQLKKAEGLVNKRATLEDSVLNTWQEYFGVTPNQTTVSWAANMMDQGWSEVDMYDYLQNTDDFKQKYPGMPQGMTPKQYDTMKQTANQKALELRAKPLSPDEWQGLLRGEVPEGGMKGQPDILNKLGKTTWWG